MKPKFNTIFRGLPLVLCLLVASCGGSLYKVKPAITAPLADDAKGSSSGDLALHAVPLLTDEESQDLFEVNLPLSGILPVRVELANSGSSALDVSKARFQLHDGAGAEWKTRSPKETVKHVMKYYDVYLYNPNSRKEFVLAMQRQGFDRKTPLAPGERRTGFVFFQIPGRQPVENPSGLVISVKALPQEIQVNLN